MAVAAAPTKDSSPALDPINDHPQPISLDFATLHSQNWNFIGGRDVFASATVSGFVPRLVE